MANPFKFGSVVEESFFTNREYEAEEANQVLNSSNHLILISPRRFGKTSLINKVTKSLDRPTISLDLQLVTDVVDFANQLLKRVLKINKWENIKHFLANFRIVPTIELNPLTNNVEVSFQSTMNNDFKQLEDVFNLIEKMGETGKKPIVVLDEFQEIKSLSSTLPKQLRSVIQHHKNVNYVFLGSLESMMKSIFEEKKSPFYHFGYLMSLGKIPYDNFFEYLQSRLKNVTDKNEEMAKDILKFTNRHPYYTQQSAFYCWAYLEKNSYRSDMLDEIIDNILKIHNTDYERLWNTISKTDKKILITLAMKEKVSVIAQPTSTIYSGLKRLLTQGFLLKNDTYEMDDPFFAQWIVGRRNNA